jgi:Fe-Mn family superoxide dismutase
MTFELAPLPYAQDALGEFMSAETLSFHHGKHHRAYVDKVNALLAEGEGAGGSLVEIVRRAHDRGNSTLFNNAAQIWNHNFYWLCLAPARGQKPEGRLAAMIDDSFGSVENLLRRMKEEAVGHFSNGWAWLVVDRGRLEVVSLHEADSPVVHEGMKPLLTLDIWEHAYYIDYRNARADFAEKVLGNIVDWGFVERNLDEAGVARADQEG